MKWERGDEKVGEGWRLGIQMMMETVCKVGVIEERFDCSYACLYEDIANNENLGCKILCWMLSGYDCDFGVQDLDSGDG